MTRVPLKTHWTTYALHVFVFSAFAVAQPVYDRLGRQARYVEDIGAQTTAVVLLVLLLSVALPLLLLALVWIIALLGSGARQRCQQTLILLLFVLIFLPGLRHIPRLPGLVEVPLGILLGVAGWWAYFHFQVVRGFISFAALGVFLFPVWLLFLSPTSRVLAPPPPPPQGKFTAKNPVPIVVLVFDEFCGLSLMDEKGQLDEQAFPHFAALARDGVWFRNATGVHSRTDAAVTSILTGKYPRGVQVPTFADHPINIFSILLETYQYEFAVFEPYTRLFPPDREVSPRERVSTWLQFQTLVHDLSIVYVRHVLATDLGLTLPDPPPTWYGVNRVVVPRHKKRGLFSYGWNSYRDTQFAHLLRAVEASSRPTFYFQHVVLPHYAWVYLPSGRKYGEDYGHNWAPLGGVEDNGEIWISDPLAATQGRQRYLLQVQYIDHLLGQLVEKLKNAGIYDECLLVVTADHGVCFTPGNSRRSPNADTVADIMSIPLFIKRPGNKKPGVSDRNVESVDVLPTILAELELNAPFEFSGQNVFAESEERPSKTLQTLGDSFVLDGEFEEKKEVLQAYHAPFGPAGDEWRWYRLGPHPQLVGQPVKKFTVGAAASETFDVDSSPFEKTDTAPIIPAYLRGELSAGQPTPTMPLALAIAVRGTIQAVTRTYTDEDYQRRWSAMLPEKAFHSPPLDIDDVTLFLVRGDAAQKEGIQLHPLTWKPRFRPHLPVE